MAVRVVHRVSPSFRRTCWQLTYRSRQLHRNPGYEGLERPKRAAERMLRLMDPWCSWKRRVRAMRCAERLLPSVEAIAREQAEAR
jgi:hypothetical protein